MTELLFDPPFYYPTGLAVLALVLLFQGNNRRNKSLKMGGLSLALLSAAWFAAGAWVATDREQVTEGSRAFAKAIGDRDWAAFEAKLDPKATLYPFYSDRAQFVAGATATTERVGIKNVSLLGIEIDDQQPGVLITNVQALATTDAAMGRPVRSNWQFYWTKNGDTWQIYDVRLVNGGDIGPEVIKGSLVRPTP